MERNVHSRVIAEQSIVTADNNKTLFKPFTGRRRRLRNNRYDYASWTLKRSVYTGNRSDRVLE